MADTFGVAVSETSVLAFTREAAQALQPIYQQIGQAVQAAPVVCADETGIRIQGHLQWLHCAHSLLPNAPHLRELLYVHDSLNEKAFNGWAGEMMDTLLQAKREVDALGGPLPPERMRWYEGQWALLLDRGERFNPRQAPEGAPSGKRGKHKQSTQFNLLARLRQYRYDVWRFATEVGARTFFAIRSYLQTMRKQHVNLFDCLVSVFDGHPISPDLAL